MQYIIKKLLEVITLTFHNLSVLAKYDYMYSDSTAKAKSKK
jgi:hypothetical protein